MTYLDPIQIQQRYEEIWAIYEEAFPVYERRTKERQLEVMQVSDYRLLVVEEQGRMLAFLGYWDLPGCCFIEHLATTPACRGKGYGKDLVTECVKNTSKPIFLEIEPITEEDPMTGRRAGFYERLDFHCNDWPYEQMPLKSGDEPCTLWVMSHKYPYSEEKFAPYKKEIYSIVYQVHE